MALTGSGKSLRMCAFTLVLLLCLTCFVPAAAAATTSATTVASATANVIYPTQLRSGAGLNYSAIDNIPFNSQLTVVDNITNAQWWRVIYNGATGYVYAGYVVITGSATAASAAVEKDLVTIRDTSLRSGGGYTYKVLLSIPAGTAVHVLDYKAGEIWLKATCGGKTGYVEASVLKEGELLTAETTATAPTPTPAPAATPAPTAAAPTATTVQTGTLDSSVAAKLAAAKKKNGDTVGWVRVPNTNIDYPILYGANWFYATHDINRAHSYNGVYAFSNYLTKNIVVFGHNLRGSQTGFHQLHHLLDSALGYSKCRYSSGHTFPAGLGSWYKTGSGNTWTIPIFGKTHWQVFAMYKTEANEPYSTLNNNWSLNAVGSYGSIQNWINAQISRSSINFGVKVSESDQILTLITCGTNYDSASANSRLFVFLKNVD